MEKFSLGDIVTLNSGSSEMGIGGFDKDGRARCMWLNENQLDNIYLKTECLTLVKHTQTMPIPVIGDVVELKTGSMQMTVEYVQDDCAFVVFSDNNNQLNNKIVIPICLLNICE